MRSADAAAALVLVTCTNQSRVRALRSTVICDADVFLM